MRIRTDDSKAWRIDLYERTAETLGESNKTTAIDSACIHTNQDIKAKQETMDFLEDHLQPGHLETAAELLSTDEVTIQTTVESTVEVEE